ncbi:MAG TPA: hypothetical protein VEL03_14555 [Streptosporangiaceae bacterium]|nr:hypothetical protein [Streptosporangiaceae bacterium]
MRSWKIDVAAALAGALLFGSALLAVPASAAVAAAHHGYERFKIRTTTVGATRDSLRAVGVLDAKGHAVPSAIVSGHGTVKLELPKGSIWLSLTVVTSSVTAPNPTTCAFTEANTGTYQVSKGSGRYKGAASSGHFLTRIAASLVSSDGVCTATLATYSKYQETWGDLSW